MKQVRGAIRWQALLFACALAQAAGGLPTLTTASQVRRLTPDEAGRGYPVRLKAVVTFNDSRKALIVVQDPTGGVYVQCGADCVALRSGQQVELAGVSGYKTISPILIESSARSLGPGALPPARPVTFAQLSSGDAFYEWVEIRGVARGVSVVGGDAELEIALDGKRLSATVLGATPADLEALVGSEIRARGIASGSARERPPEVTPRLRVPSLRHIAVERAAPADPFATPLTTAAELARFAPGSLAGQRVRVRGAVTFSTPGELYLRDMRLPLVAETRGDAHMAVGDIVEVAGFPARTRRGTMLEDAVARRLGQGPRPPPALVTAGEAIAEGLAGELIQIDAELIGRASAGGEQTLLLRSGELIFSAYLRQEAGPDPLRGAPDGSSLRVAGICALATPAQAAFGGQRLRLRLRSAADFQILARPSPWTLARSLAALGAMGVLIALCLTWACLLRARVRQQTALIRERLKRQAALEERYRELFENAQDIVYTVDLSMRFTSINPAGERITGYTRAEALGLSAQNFVKPRHWARQARIWNQVLSGQTPRPFEVDVIAKDGRTVTLELTAHLIYQDGRPVGIEGIGRDITSRKLAESALRDSEERYRRLFDSNPLPAFVYDRETLRFLAVNAAAIRNYGYTREEMLAMDLTGIRPPEDIPAVLRTVPLHRRESVSGPWRHRRKDGSLFLAEVTSHDVVFEGRTARLSLIRDVTERQRVEAEMARNARELEEARRAAENGARIKSQFLATMSHEIRTPMNGVIGMTQLLLDTPLDPAQREYGETIRGSAESLLTIINDILDFSKIEAGKMTVESIPFHPRQTLEEALDLLALQAREKRLELRLDYGEHIPSELVGDPGRLRQVVLNLAGNAVKFTSQGGVVVRVRAAEPAAAGSGALLRFEVEDTGPGIPESKRGLMFQSFTQADASTTRRFGGTGLGLAISRQLVELMGGRIGVESVEGKGSIFWFELALAGPASGESAARPAAAAPEPNTGALLNLHYRVLLAEDNVVNQRVAAMILRKFGCRMDVAANGREAVDLWEKLPYDLIFMDCQMPEMDGYEATAEIRRREAGGRHTPIVAMTANAMQGDRQECLAAGMDDYVAKPIDPQQVRGALVRWAGGGGPCPAQNP